MNVKDTLRYCINSLSEAGVDKSQTWLTNSKKYELNVDGGEVSLLRTTLDTNLKVIAIKDNRKGEISISKVDTESIDKAIENVLKILETSEIDEAYDIADHQEAKTFKSGDKEIDLDKMYTQLKNFIEKVKTKFPKVNLEQVIIEFNRIERYLMNSNEVDFRSTTGTYDFTTMFSSKDGEKTTSFNYTAFSLKDLERELMDCGSIAYLLEESVEQLNAKPLEGKFVGDIIITPDCLEGFISYYNGIFLSDSALISGTSRFKDKINEQVASNKLTLRTNPVDEGISKGYFITPDGFEAENLTLIKNGVLKSFLLSQYGANKTNLTRSKNVGGAYIVDTGDKELKELIKNIDKGLLVSRFSGGNPSPYGDFSGVAKNSFYIENGEIKYPITETMISSNLCDVFKNINGISKEYVDFGTAILPWISVSGVTISGK
ncbi:MAG: TldD/PmbA family protein [Firmicutes bacterium]|nr:TldD/PmbA family protein [Bacillota bacterium]